MSPSQVNECICITFKHLKLSLLEYLEAFGGQVGQLIIVSSNQNSCEEVVDRKGMIYIHSRKDTVVREVDLIMMFLISDIIMILRLLHTHDCVIVYVYWCGSFLIHRVDALFWSYLPYSLIKETIF